MWYVYAIKGTTKKGNPPVYIGCTTDLLRRLKQHNGEVRGGAKYTRRFRPWVIIASYGPIQDRSTAQKMEAELRRDRPR